MTPRTRYAAAALVLAALLLAVSMPQNTPLSAQVPPTVPPPEGVQLALPLVYQRSVPDIAFSYRERTGVLGPRAGDIGMLSATGVAEWRVTRNLLDRPRPSGYVSWGPDWSPDGKRLAFSHYEAENEDIHIYDVATGTITRITNTPDIWESNPSWSPDGQRIAFSCDSDLCTMNPSGGDRRLLAPGIRVTQMRGPAWAPDGSQIAYAATRDGQATLCVIQADGTNERRLGPDDYAPVMFDPVWSPNGQWLAIYVQVGESTDVYRVSVSSGEWTRVSDMRAAGSPAWSPDGQWLAFLACGADLCALWVVHPDGSEPRIMDMYGSNPAWSPDSQWLAFEVPAPNHAQDIWVASLDGADRRNLTEHIFESAEYPIWRPKPRDHADEPS